MMEINMKGCKELLMHRMFLAIISSIAVQFFFVSCLLLITNISADYTSWIHGTWSTITSIRMWCYFFVLASVTFLQGITCSKNYLNMPPYQKSRFDKFCGMFTSQNMLLALLYVTIGGVLVWLHLSLKGGHYSSLTTQCSKIYGLCLVEEHSFLLLSGLWSGIYFFAKTNVLHVKYFKFPIISLSKFFRLKRGIYSMLPSLMVTSLWPTLYYLVGYYFLGSYFRSVTLFLTSSQLETKPLDTISRILSLSLLLYLWLYQLIFILTINSMYLLFEVHLTEWVAFEFRQIHVFNNDGGNVTLPEALSMDKVPIIQHLGYLDLVTIAQKEKARRSIIFTLSQPGGHPYNWNCIVEKCASLIKKFSEDLNTASTKSQEQTPIIASVAAAPVPPIHKEYTYHMRNLVTKTTPPVTVAETIDTKKSLYLQSLVQTFVKSKWDALVVYILSKSIVQYVFGEQEGGKVSHVLFNGQSIIWAADAVSSFAVLSLHEDAYGIVQKDLPQIITTLLGLKQALDKLHKMHVLAKKHQLDDEFIKQMFTSLRAATKRSIYRIVTNFEAYINDLGLEPVMVEQLQPFVNCRE